MPILERLASLAPGILPPRRANGHCRLAGVRSKCGWVRNWGRVLDLGSSLAMSRSRQRQRASRHPQSWDLYANEIPLNPWTIRSHDLEIDLDTGSYRCTISDAGGVLYDTGHATAIIDGGSAITGVDGFRTWQWGTLGGPAHGGADDGVGTALDNFYVNTDTGDPFPIPEPAKFALLALGGLMLCRRPRERRRCRPEMKRRGG